MRSFRPTRAICSRETLSEPEKRESKKRVNSITGAEGLPPSRINPRRHERPVFLPRILQDRPGWNLVLSGTNFPKQTKSHVRESGDGWMALADRREFYGRVFILSTSPYTVCRPVQVATLARIVRLCPPIQRDSHSMFNPKLRGVAIPKPGHPPTSNSARPHTPCTVLPRGPIVRTDGEPESRRFDHPHCLRG